MARVFELMSDAIRGFANDHRSETFYGIRILCDSFQKSLRVDASTPDYLWELVKLWEQDPLHLAELPDFLDGLSLEEVEAELRWRTDFQWKYSEVFTFDPQGDLAQQHAELFSDSDNYEPGFLDLVCKAALRMDEEGIFGLFQTTPDFEVMCVDEECEETIEDSRARFARLRTHR